MLNGYICKVNIANKISEHCSKGFYNDLELRINNANKFVGKEILAKIDLWQYKNHIYGNFLTEDTTNYEKEYSPEKYILLAKWDESMNKERFYPTIEEINQYYDPGDLRYYVFISKFNKFDEKKIACLTNSECRLIKGKTISRIIREYLPNPKKLTRLILTNSEYGIDFISDSIREKGLEPIILEKK